MKLISWNVNGIRACLTKGFIDFFKEIDADIFCLQETKCQPDQIDLEFDGLNWVQLYSDTNRINTSFDFIEYKLYNDNNRLSMYDIFKKNLFLSNSKKAVKAKKVSESCFICDKVEWGISRMIDTIYRTYENELDFRNMFNSQPMFCLPHYERLINGIDKKQMKRYAGEFADNLTRITANYAKSLSDDITNYCAEYNYCQTGGKAGFEGTKDSVQRSIAFLSGKIVE